MATAGKIPETLYSGSEEIFEFCCTPCSNDGDSVEAVNLCLDCNEYFCTKCIKFHNKFGTTSGHKVLDQKDMEKTRVSNLQRPAPPPQKCKAHGGERITAFCANHDVVCCNTGVAVDHKNCSCIEYIVDAASGIKYSKVIQKTKASIGSTLKEAKGKKSTLQTDLADLDNDKAVSTKQVHAFTERQIHRLQELENTTIEKINSEHKERNADITRDLTSLDDVISTLDGDLQKLDRSHDNQEAQAFVDVKLGQHHEAQGRNLLQQLSNSRKPSINIQLHDNIERELKDLSSIGSLAEDNRVYKAKLFGDFNIKMNQDRKHFDISGSCQLPDGTLIITDPFNRRVKRLDASYSLVDHCNTPRGAWGIACTAPAEVVVTMTNVMKVQFISVRDSMTLTRSFSSNAQCRGICYRDGQLYVSCGDQTPEDILDCNGHVAVFSLMGVPVRKIQIDTSGQKIFSNLFHICASYRENVIYIADYDKGVKLLDIKGVLIDTITHPLLKNASGVCCLDNGHILVCGFSSNNVLQFDGDGRKVTELLNETDGILGPRSLTYDMHTSRLVVTMDDTDIIKVFDLK